MAEEQAPLSETEQLPFRSYFKSQQDQELIRLALHKSPFFASLDQEQVERFVAVAELKQFQAGEIVILEGCVDDDDDDDENEDASAAPAEEEDGSPTLLAGGSQHGGGDDDDSSVEAPADPDESEEPDEAHVDEAGTSSASAPESSPESLPKEKLSTDNSSSLEDEQKGGNEPQQKQLAEQQQEEEDDTLIDPSSIVVSNHETQNDSSTPPPPRSGVKRSIYIVRNGNADVWYQPHFSPASLGQASLIGEGGFLFQRQHSASVVARDKLECWVVDFATFSKHVLPASSKLNDVFAHAALHRDGNGEAYMTMQEFVQTRQKQQQQSEGGSSVVQDPLVGVWMANAYNLLQPATRKSTTTSHLPTAMPSQEPRIYLPDFCFFHLLMARPDPEVDIAFLLMDRRRTGQIYLEDMAKFVEPVFKGLDLSSHFFQRYFGKDGKQAIRQMHFSQFMVDLQREIGKQAFLRKVEERGNPEGYLDPSEFIQVLKTASGWRLPQSVADRLEDTYDTIITTNEEGSGEETVHHDSQSSNYPSSRHFRSQYFAYGDFLAFQEVLGNLPAICSLIDRTQEIKKAPISHDDFMMANRTLGLGGRLSRRQVEIVFSLFDLDRDGYISHSDTVEVCGVNFSQRLVERDGKLTYESSLSPKSTTDTGGTERKKMDLPELLTGFARHFGLTTVSSSLGVLLLYPLDLAKTRLMNERIRLGTSGMYKGWTDCLRQVVRFEGAGSLYRGLTPQLLGFGPEKLIKLYVNDLLRQAFRSLDSNQTPQQSKRAYLPLEVLAGACAGACQLLVTNPMEISKIIMQLQGDTSSLTGIQSPRIRSFSSVIRGLGFPGVYRGASACLLRDVPFSAIYFPTYAACKDWLVDPARGATQGNLLLAGTLAGVPAAFLTSPADVIKTRLQAARRPEAYTGIRACATAIYETEGWQAFFRGSAVRVLRLAPQFGITLLGYEQLTHWLAGSGDMLPRPPTNAPIHPQDYRSAFLWPSKPLP